MDIGYDHWVSARDGALLDEGVHFLHGGSRHEGIKIEGSSLLSRLGFRFIVGAATSMKRGW